MSQRQLAQTSGAERVRLARDYYSYLHLPMIAGIVLFALGLKTTIEHVDEPLDTVPAVALCGGLALYFLTHVALRVRLVHFIRRTTTERPGWIGPGRLATSIAMLALIPAALELPALASLALVAAVCCALIAWDVIHYREDRAEVRRARPLRRSLLSLSPDRPRRKTLGVLDRVSSTWITTGGSRGWVEQARKPSSDCASRLPSLSLTEASRATVPRYARVVGLKESSTSSARATEEPTPSSGALGATR